MEKLTEDLKTKVSVDMRDRIRDLAFAQDRSPSEFVRHVLALYLYGHVRQIEPEPEKERGPDRASQGPKKRSTGGSGRNGAP